MSDERHKSDDKWRDRLTPEQYAVCRRRGTEPPFSGTYWNCKDTGTYRCVCCGAELFSSETKFDSGSGWPSFFAAIDPQRIRQIEDLSHGMRRTEVRCAGCEAHLGHLFDDGPAPGGNRFCINSTALDLEREKKE